ncbi:heat shock protein DnaJ domain-containing protein [Salinisphaera sp. S4-8]|uniref:hypothetical protein n=1 Tax=Salinisphaera sp. S4-8 TaxID=633357 RepID=UPI00334144E3
MSETMAQRLIHPAHAQLVEAARAERRALVRALAIEADWRFHDGPEWAARYWAAFGDLRRDVDSAPELRLGAALAPRSGWSPLAPVESDQARAIFRALLAALHPQVAPRAAAADTEGLWSLAVRAYRGGDAARLRELLARAQPNAAAARLPDDIVALRSEHDRLVGARAAVDRRLAELSQSFPFNLRDRLDDADWVRRQRLGLRQVLEFVAPPRRRSAQGDRQQVS